jgi:hypothetical protein
MHFFSFIDDESQSESEALSSFNISRVTHESSTAKSPIQSPVSVTSETEEESRDGKYHFIILVHSLYSGIIKICIKIIFALFI